MTGWGGLLPHIELPPPGRRPTAFIVILVDKLIAPDPRHAEKDVGIAAQTILLGAVEMGLSGCMIGSFKPQLREALKLPGNLEIALLVALGKGTDGIEIIDGGDRRYYGTGRENTMCPSDP